MAIWVASLSTYSFLQVASQQWVVHHGDGRIQPWCTEQCVDVTCSRFKVLFWQFHQRHLSWWSHCPIQSQLALPPEETRDEEMNLQLPPVTRYEHLLQVRYVEHQGEHLGVGSLPTFVQNDVLCLEINWVPVRRRTMLQSKFLCLEDSGFLCQSWVAFHSCLVRLSLLFFSWLEGFDQFFLVHCCNQ